MNAADRPEAEPRLTDDGAGALAPRHVVVTGSGRSGTNRMLDVFDLDDSTLCRSEVHALRTDFGAWTDAYRPADLPAEFEAMWRAAVRAATAKQSARDRHRLRPKTYLRPGARLVLRALRSPRVRRRIMPPPRDEWRIPPWCLRPGAEIVPVLKIQSRAAWFLRTHAAEPGQTIVHTVRDPTAYLESWWKRFVRVEGVETVYANVRRQSREIIAAHGRPPLPETFSMEDLLRGEFWLWRLNNDRLHALSASPRYGLFRYEDMSRDPVAEAERAYALAGLDFTPVHRARVRAMRNTLFKPVKAEALDPGMVRAVAREILQDSPLGSTYLS